MAEKKLKNWFIRKISGHLCIGPIIIYGRNAMHFAVNIETRWGWICFKPITRCFGVWWPSYFYISKDATPHNYWGYYNG